MGEPKTLSKKVECLIGAVHGFTLNDFVIPNSEFIYKVIGPLRYIPAFRDLDHDVFLDVFAGIIFDNTHSSINPCKIGNYNEIDSIKITSMTIIDTPEFSFGKYTFTLAFNDWLYMNCAYSDKRILYKLIHIIHLRYCIRDHEYRVSDGDIEFAVQYVETEWLTLLCQESDDAELRAKLFDLLNQPEHDDLFEIKILCLNEMNHRGELVQVDNMRL